MSKKLKAYNIFDLREMAKKRVPRGPFEFMDRGTEEEVSLRNNREVFERRCSWTAASGAAATS